MPANKKTAKKRKAKKINSKEQPGETKQAANSKKRSTSKKQKSFPIVGIGASAGGLEALERFFSNIPAQSGLAFVVVQHLAPHHRSIMDSLLKKYTGMRILQAQDGMKIEPNCIYLNPPDKDMTVMNATLCLMEPSVPHGGRLPINCFFRSLAADQREKAICIILSGTGSDGTLGLKAIKGEGGIAIVQEEKQAKYDSMPRSAIDTDMVDFVLPVEKMGKQLAKYIKHPYIEGRARPVTPKQRYIDSVRRIFVLIRASTGLDFSNYKLNTIHRRIERRMAVHQIERIEDYIRYLQQKSVEVETLSKDMLIMVTNFFRDPEAFEVLKEKVIQALLKNKESDSPVRVWVPGCGTGEEAYSIAMLLAEGMDKLKKHFSVQIFGTDLDAEAIEYARGGIYPEAIAADVSAERLKLFFMNENDRYKVKNQIREAVVFAVQNLIKDPPFSKLDIVSCRNVLIYMDTVLQKKVLPLFHYVLVPGGYLFLGSSETISGFNDCFSTIDTKWKIFQRRMIAPKKTNEYPGIPLGDIETTAKLTEPEVKPAEANIRQVAERMILENYAPPCVLVNEKYEILYFHGQTEDYLSPPTGEPTFNILEISRPELRHKIRTLLNKVIKEKKTAVAEGLQVRHNDGFLDMDLEVRPLVAKGGAADLMMVIFQSRTRREMAAKKKKKAFVEEADQPVAALERELASTKERLQTTIEELQTSNEELKSTNEELQSTNEELQSTNEELETSREELQSTNEELETVNAELRDRVDELSKAHNDLNNLLGSTEIGVLFLDTDLHIKRFTPAVTTIFNLKNGDVGRPISDITSKMTYPNLSGDAQRVLDTLRVKETEIQADDGKWFSMRILPYRTTENVIDGLVLTFMSIDQLKEREQLMRRLVAVVADSNDAITVHELNGEITAWNKGATKMYGYTEAEALQMNIADIVPKDKKGEELELIKQIKKGKPVKSIETRRVTKDGHILNVWLTVTKLVDNKGNVVAVATTERDISEIKNLTKLTGARR